LTSFHLFLLLFIYFIIFLAFTQEKRKVSLLIFCLLKNMNFKPLKNNKIEINEKQSAFNFMYGFTQWLGIKEKHLSGVDFFNPKEQKIKVFDWENIIDVNLCF